MAAVIMFCPVCGQGMFIKDDFKDEIFECIDENCDATLRIEQDGSRIMIVEYIERKQKM